MRLKEARKSAGLTQKEVALYVGVNQNTYSYWENEKTRIDSASLSKLAKLFGVTTDYLLDGAPGNISANSATEKLAVRNDDEKLLGVYHSLDDQSKTQLMSVAYMLAANNLAQQGVDVNQLVEQQLHKIHNKGGEEDEG